MIEFGRIAVLAALLICGGPALAQQPAALVLRNAHVADAGGARGVATTIVLRGRNIERIGDGPAPADAEVMDVEGRWVIPGLIDAHTHIESRAAAKRALESGVTAFRSASADNYQDVGLRELARAGAVPGPDVYAAGVFVTPELGETILADPKFAALAGGVRTPEELRLLVRVNAEHKVDWIKTRGTERAGLADTDPRKQVYTEAQLRAIVEEAAAHGIPVEVHAHGDEGARAAVLAGARSIEHGSFLSEATLQLMKERGTYLVPTYVTIEDMGYPVSTALGLVPGAVQEGALTIRGRFMLPRVAEVVRRAYAMGIKLVAGADTDYGPKSAWRLAHEVESFVKLGVSPKDALAAATTVAAELLGAGDRLGRVRPGYEADLLVVDRNPLEDIRTLQDPLLVVSNGRIAVNRLPFAIPDARK